MKKKMEDEVWVPASLPQAWHALAFPPPSLLSYLPVL